MKFSKGKCLTQKAGSILLVSLVFIPIPGLVIVQAPSGAVIWKRPMLPHSIFSICFRHSVTLKEVEDTYILRWKSLLLTQTRFEVEGAGLEYSGEGIELREGGWTVFKELHREVPSLPLRVGTVADHRLVFDGREYHLKKLAPPGTLVWLKPCWAPCIAWLWWLLKD